MLLFGWSAACIVPRLKSAPLFTPPPTPEEEVAAVKGRTMDVAEALLALLPRICSLRILDLSKLSIKREDTERLAGALTHVPLLHTLDVSFNLVTDDAIAAVVAAFPIFPI
jgi:hypothetical protein